MYTYMYRLVKISHADQASTTRCLHTPTRALRATATNSTHVTNTTYNHMNRYNKRM